MRWSGVSKSNTPRFVTTRRISWNRAASGRARRPGRSRCRTRRRRARRTPSGEWFGHPVDRRVVDRVARRAAEAEQLRLRRVRVGADGGDVLVAVPVDLGGAHHHVAPAAPHHVEHAPVRVVGLDDPVVGAGARLVVGDEHRLAVGHHQVGLEGGAGQPAADHRDRADRVGQASRRRPGSTRPPRPRTPRPGSTSAALIDVASDRPASLPGTSASSGSVEPLGPERGPRLGSLGRGAYSRWNASSRS